MKAHWIKFAPADFLNGVADLNAEQTGAYITVLCLIWDRSGPIPDDEGWLARRIGITKLQWRKIRGQLFELGKLSLDDAGNLTNRRAMQEVHRVQEISRKRAEAAHVRHGTEPDFFEGETGENRHSGDANARNLDVSGAKMAENGHSRDANASSRGSSPAGRPEQKPAGKPGENGEKNGRFLEKKSPENSANPLETPDQGDASADFLRAGARENKNKRLESTTPNERTDAARGGDRPGPIYDLAMACCEAAGMGGRAASRPALIGQSIEIVQGWQAAGVDILAQAVPWITEAADRMDEPAHSLAKFSAMIDTKAARAKRQRTKLGRDPSAPPDLPPQFEFEDEAPPIAAFRRELAKALPPGRYARLCNGVRFQATDWRAEGDQAMLIVTPRTRGGWSATDPAEILERQHGDRLRPLARKMLGSEAVTVRHCSKPSGSQP